MAETLEIILKDMGQTAAPQAMPQGQATALAQAMLQMQQEQVRREAAPEKASPDKPEPSASAEQKKTETAGRDMVRQELPSPQPSAPEAPKGPGNPDIPANDPRRKGPGLPDNLPTGGKPPAPPGGAGAAGKPPVPAGGAGGMAGTAGKAGAGAAGAGGAAGMAGAAGAAGGWLAAIQAVEKEINETLRSGVEKLGKAMTRTAALDVAAFGDAAQGVAKKIPLFGEALSEGVKQARGFFSALEGTASKLSAYSGPLAQAQAMNEVKTILGDIKRAEILGADLAPVMEEITEIRETLKTLMAQILKPALKPLLALLQQASDFLVFLENAIRKKLNLPAREAEAMINFVEEVLGAGGFKRPDMPAPPRAR